jgi:Smg protein
MKQDMFDVLLYLFENYISEQQLTLPDEPGMLSSALEDAGFKTAEIHKAFSWLEGLTELRITSTQPHPMQSFRIFSDEEQARLGQLGMGFILFLEQHSIVDTQTRELILDRLLALDSFTLGLEQVKWIALIVIYHQNRGRNDLELVEDLLFLDNASQTLH